ncbi:TIGR04086 family membrane protein [Paenibacillus sp. P96]|uniref:TIGR04086 family membrane protein n=1 Tax=Paenibacillus zeirhizosphaerae TaxID=2987519 RepID=A0ABT9FKD5_9BACL|nr:TIGR04086 family membrane protein [Paenibacillus sp. P96]MDP4095193.1 TIGR04086 family membrane protein [Paenibacillus sp. P96]
MDMIRRWSYRVSSPLLSGLFYAFIWMMAGALVLSLLLWLTGMQEQDLSLFTYIIHGISMLAGGFVSGKRSGKKGWYRGGVTGLVYGVAVLVIGFLALDSRMNVQDLLHLSAAFILGAFGGMLGINLSKTA